MVGVQTPSSVEGSSLLPILKNPKKEVKKSALSFIPKGTSMRTEKWAYMKYKGGAEELYDMKNDPKQFKNLVLNDSYSEVLNKLRTQFKNRNKSN